MRILLVGGGSGGPVSPLLAVAEHIKQTHPKASFLFIGGKIGPESQMAGRAGIPFVSITSGKFRRYFSWTNFSSPFLVIVGFFQALKILKEFRPNCVFGTGSFVQVPVIYAARFLKIPVAIHQQDLVPGLANKLCQFAAEKITVSFEDSLANFSENLGLFYKKRKTDKIVLTGNPFREELSKGSKVRAEKEFHLNSNFPTLLVIGGGTGSAFLNELILASLPSLTKTVQIIHSTGGRKIKFKSQENYHAFEFINNMADAYAAADFVLPRAGMSTITELSNLKKLGIIIALPNTHQETNAWYLMRQRAAIILPQAQASPEILSNLVRKLLFAHDTQKLLQSNMAKIMPQSATEKISEIIIKLAEQNG